MIGGKHKPRSEDRGLLAERVETNCLFVGRGLRAAGAAATLPGTRAGRRLLGAGAVAGLVPAAPLEGEAGQGDLLLDPTAAGGAGGQGCIGKLLAGFEDDPAIMALVLVNRHGSQNLRSGLRR